MAEKRRSHSDFHNLLESSGGKDRRRVAIQNQEFQYFDIAIRTASSSRAVGDMLVQRVRGSAHTGVDSSGTECNGLGEVEHLNTAGPQRTASRHYL